jgi:capsular polysaccharide biosynthesis protein
VSVYAPCARYAKTPASAATGSQLTANVYGKAVVPESPVSPKPLRNGLFTLVVGLVLASLGALIAGRGLLRR